MEILFTLIKLVLCHLVGDYVLQCDFIASSKGKNWYHLFVHCALYCLPFVLLFGFVWQLIPLFVLHIVVDMLKARFKVIPYWLDQVIHYATLLLYLIP